MTHHDVNMRRTLTRRNSRSKPARQHRANTVRLAPLSASDSLPTRNSLHRQGGEWQGTRSNCMGLRPAHNIAQERRFSRVQGSTDKICHRRRHKDNRRTSINHTEQISCMAWLRRKRRNQHNRRTNKSHNTGNEQALAPRHSRPSLGCHRRPNIILQDSLVRLAQRRPNSPLKTYLHNIRSLTYMPKLVLHPHILIQVQ